MSIEDEHHRLYKYKSMNEAAEFFDCASMCRHRKLLEFFKEFTPNCKNNCDICTATTPLHIAQDCTVIARSILDGIKDINAVTDKISVKLLAQVLFGSSAAEIKSLGLDRSRVFGSAKSYYRERNGKQKDLQNFIYHLLVIGILTEEPTGTPDRPSIVIKTGYIDPVIEDKDIWY